MKLLFLLLFVSLVGLAFGYESGKEYKHKLEAYVYTSIKNSKNQCSGTATIGDVIIQVQSDNYSIKINNIRFDVVNELIEGNFEKYPFTFKDVPAFSDHISKPFKAVIQNGQIKQVFIRDDEPDWSVDLKKSFLNLLQLTFGHDNHSHASSDADFYTVSEKGSFGECETTYSIKSEPSLSNSENVLNVTKVRNYEKCSKKPHPFRYAAETGQRCHEFGGRKKQILRKACIYDYNLRGSFDEFVIEKVVQREYVTSSPFENDGLTFELKSKRVLELLNVNDISEALIIPDDVIPSTDLSSAPLQQNEFFDNIDLRRAHFLRDIYRYQANTNQIVTLLDETVADYSNHDTNSAESVLPSKYGEIVDAISTLDYEGIEQIFNSVFEKSDDHRSLFIDALVASGTNPSFLFSKYLIEEKKVTDFRARSLLTRLSLNIKESSETLFNEFYQLCTSSAVQESNKLKRACYLSFSALVSKECVNRYQTYSQHIHSHHRNDNKISDHSKHHCNPEVASKYFKLIVTPEVGAQLSIKETILLIKTAGNFRAKEAISYLKDLIYSSQVHYIRSTAAWNLIGIAKVYPEEVRAVAAPLFFNKSEEQDIRIAGLSAWFHSGPNFAQLQLIAKQMFVETNRQIVSMAYTSIKQLSESDYPCYKPFVKDLQSILWVFKIAFDKHGGRVKSGDSRNYIRSFFDEQFGIGGVRQFSVIASNRSYIPNNIYFKLNDFIAGNSFETFAVSIQSYGLEKIVNRLFGRKGVVWRKPSIFDIFKKRVSRDAASIEAELKEIEKALPIVARESDQIRGDISLYMQGYSIAYMDFDEQLFTSTLSDGTITIPDIQQLLDLYIGGKNRRYFLLSKNRMTVFRTEVGVPYFYQYRTLTQRNFMNNKFSLNVKPGFFSEDRENKPPTEVQLTADLKYVANSHSYAINGLLLPVVSSKVGVGVNRKTVYSLPMNFDLNYSVQNKKLEIKKVPISQDIFYDKVTPFTFLDSYANKIPLLSEPGFKPIYRDSSLRKIDRSYFQEYFGFGLKVEGNVRNSDKSEWFKFMSEKSLSEKLAFFRTQPVANPYEIRVTTAPPQQNPTTEFTLTLSAIDNVDEENEVTDFSFNEDSYFKDYTSRGDRKAVIHSLQLDISGAGNIQRNINAKIKYSHSRDTLFHKLNINYDRSPINDNGYKVCATASMKFPDYDLKKFVKLDTLDLDQTVNLTGKIAFGENCETAAKINIKAQMSQTEEQKQMERTRDNPSEDSPNPYATNYNYCRNLYKFKYDVFPYCYKYLYPITQMRNFVAAIDYENIPERLTNYTQKMIRMMSRKRFPYSDFSMRYEDSTPGHIRYESNTSVVNLNVDYRLYAPYYTAIYKEVPLSRNLIPVFTFPIHELKYSQVLRKFIKNPYCWVQENLVQTFDNVSYSLPPIDGKCFTVIAKDCSDEQNFLVLAAKNNERSTIKMYLSNKYKIELIPGEDGITVQINGKQVPITRSEPYTQNMQRGNKEIELFSITFNGVYYRLEANKFGVSLSTDGNGFGVEVEEYFTGKVCGICGDNNGDASNEFRAPNGRVFRNSNPFAYSYVLKDANCEPQSDWDNDNDIL